MDDHSSPTGAVHEAGHAVVAERLGHRVLRVTDCLTSYHHGPASVRHGIVITAAGDEAERMMFGKAAGGSDRRGFETDFQLIRRYVEGRAVSLPDARAYARREARRILMANWEEVRRVADVLKTRNLGGAEIRRMIGRRTVRGAPGRW